MCANEFICRHACNARQSPYDFHRKSKRGLFSLLKLIVSSYVLILSSLKAAADLTGFKGVLGLLRLALT